MAKRKLEPNLDYQKAFGSRIRELREKVGWTQPDLSIHSDVSESQISLIENGWQGPNLQTIIALSTALGKRPSELFDFRYPFKLNTSFPRKTERKKGATAAIRKLANTTFFNSPKLVTTVIERCAKEFDIALKSIEAASILGVLVKEKVLKATKTKGGRNQYQKR